MLRIPLRNLIAQAGLGALADPARGGTLHALAQFVRLADAGDGVRLGPDATAALGAAGDVFDATDGGGLRLRREHTGALGEMRTRVDRVATAVDANTCGRAPFAWDDYHGLPWKGAPRPDESTIRWVLCAAALLFEHALYFEVHEVIEPCWLRTDGRDRTFFKGLIQVAVGLHHHHNGNLAGARSLLADGNARLKSCRPAYRGMDLDAFCAGIDDCLAALRAPDASGRPLRAVPRFDLNRDS